MTATFDSVRVRAYHWIDSKLKSDDHSKINSDDDSKKIKYDVQVRPRKGSNALLHTLLALAVISTICLVFHADCTTFIASFPGKWLTHVEANDEHPRLSYKTDPNGGSLWHFGLEGIPLKRLENTALTEIRIVLDCTDNRNSSGHVWVERPMWRHNEGGAIEKGALAAITRMSVDSQRLDQTFLRLHLNPTTFQIMCEHPDQVTIIASLQIGGKNITASVSIPFKTIAELFDPSNE